MGGAGTASAQETSATWYNPALIAAIPQMPVFGATYYQPQFREGYNPPDYYSHVTVAVDSSVFFDWLRGRASATIMVLETARGPISGSMSGIGAGYGTCITPRIAAGISGTWVIDSGSQQATWSFAFDAGILWRATQNLNLGAALRNLGPTMDYGTAIPAELPVRAAVGMRWRILDETPHTFVLATDLTKSLVREPGGRWYLSPFLGWSDEPLRDEIRQIDLSTGVEYAYFQTLFVRTGLFHDQDGNRTRITWGLGLRIPFFGRFAGGSERIVVDFTSFVPLREADQPSGHSSQRIKFSMGFVL